MKTEDPCEDCAMRDICLGSYCINICCYECRDSVRFAGYPTIEEVEERYEELKNWEKVAESFGLTRKVIQGIRKRAGKL